MLVCSVTVQAIDWLFCNLYDASMINFRKKLQTTDLLEKQN